MYRIYFYALILVGLGLEACEKPVLVPDCIQLMLPIDGEFTDAALNDFVYTPHDPIPPRDIIAVYQLVEDGETYYEVELGCCDHFTELYNQNCELICSPRGGISGGGAGDCPEWVYQAERELFWEKK